MAEYVEREAVEKMLEDAQIITDGEYCGYCTEDVDVSKLPAADVVEVVRCKDCKHENVHHAISDKCTWCEYWGIDPDFDDFCSYGERRESDATD